MIKDKFGTKDKMSLVLKGPDGKVKDRRLVLNESEGEVTGRRLQDNVGFIKWIAYAWKKMGEY